MFFYKKGLQALARVNASDFKKYTPAEREAVQPEFCCFAAQMVAQPLILRHLIYLTDAFILLLKNNERNFVQNFAQEGSRRLKCV